MATTRTVYPIFPNVTNHYNTLFGGQVMAWMDQAGFICATRRRKVVTAHTGAVVFKLPIPVGTMVDLIATLTKVGSTSMDIIRIDVWIEPRDHPERQLAAQWRRRPRRPGRAEHSHARTSDAQEPHRELEPANEGEGLFSFCSGCL